ncbi:AAA domain-containing protein [Gallibacterium anatis]|uniref:AAA domain-containing protein n=1 Tax=Gallibacterium anatis TaxID=750 RepID=UPI00057D5944|nr:AAA domain-containing protein [Gallibacterium anatis]
MEVQDWGGGLTKHEVAAIEKMKQAFKQPESQTKTTGKGFEALKALRTMFPWKGYSGFRFVDASKEGEFDLVIITHCNVLIIELKDWNGGKITSRNNKWFLGNQDRGRSPVSSTRNKQHLLEDKLDKYKQKFTNKGYRPQVHFLVVMTGNADWSELPDSEKYHVMNLSDFLKLKNEDTFNKRFRPHPDSKTLNQDFELFNKKIFGTDKVKPKSIGMGGYTADSAFDSPDFKHPKDIYREYLAHAEQGKSHDVALLRRWDFTQIKRPDAQTPDGRYRLVSREYDVLQHIKQNNQSLYQACLNYKNRPQKGEITAEYIDLFELYPQQKRFNQFVGGHHVENLSEERRLGLVKLLLDKFAQLHKIGIAHRDLGANSIWLSSDDNITLSGFATAYFSSEQTVGDIREILEVSGDLAKTAFPLSGGLQLTPYHLDVRSLAILAWHIIKAKRISPNSLQEMAKSLPDETTWYAEVLRTALSDTPFENADNFFNAFNQAKPDIELDFSFDFGKLEPFYYDINHSREYREDDDFIVETSEKEVYCSNGSLVKAWLGQDPKQDSHLARTVLQWLENMACLANLSPDYLPKIHHFGIARKSSSLFAVSDFIGNGLTWSKVVQLSDLSEEHKHRLINQLLHSVEHLHGLGLTHGDLKPDNVMIVNANDLENSHLYLLDILDFSADGERPFNTQYSPEFERVTQKQRDNFAVMKMACELLGVAWNMPSENYADIAEAVQNEYAEPKTAFISLERFQAALTPKASTSKIEIIVGGGGESFESLGIFPDNGELFVQFEKSKQNDVLVKFIGLGGIVRAFYSVSECKLTRALPPILRDYINRKDRDTSVLSLPIALTISHGKFSDLKALNHYLSEQDIFQQAINDFINTQIFKQSGNEIVVDEEVQCIDALESNEAETINSDTLDEIAQLRPSIQDLWQAILDTETEALPSITASAELQRLETGEIYIPYESEIDPTEQFKKDDIVEAIGKSPEGEKTFKYGTVDIGKSNLKELRLKNKNLGNSAHRITEGTPVYLQSKQNKASFTRRKNALQRILDGEAVIKDLPHYFDEHCSLSATDYGIRVSDDEFARYDQPDKNVRLNDAQCIAFSRLISNGPLSLLQGPPGTGKTEFIAAFVHYLFTVQKVRNILLVSQSHEAVNTAAERIRKHCQRLKTPLEIVRFSNREIADSEILEDVFSPNLVGQKCHQLNVNKLDNIRQLGRAMGLPESYLLERAKIEFEIGTQIRRYEKIVKNHKEDIDEDEKRLRQPIERAIREQAKALGIIDNMIEVQEIMPALVRKLDEQHDITPAESVQARKLIDLTRDMLDVLSNDRTNYDEFLARSRQLVVGTCVGIGQKHIGIADNIYDWVIVDEAARSISSELAIAMQSGTRILLVGDHKQLPPLYSAEHKNALARRLGISKRGEELDQVLGSDFERVFNSEYGKRTCATLKTQYRMAPAIGSLVSACFYNGVLENGKADSDVPNIYFRLPEIWQNSVTWLDTTKLPNSYHDKLKNSFSNRAEADTIIQLLKNLADDDTFMQSDVVKKCLEKNEQAIGVICMYGEQKKLIRKLFNEKMWDDHFRRLVKIDSVDSYQGKENRVIILSLSRHDKEYSTGFLYLPNRINVALSRAMDKLIIVGAKAVWEHPKNAKMPLGNVLSYMKKHTAKGQYVVKTLSQGAKNERTKNTL